MHIQSIFSKLIFSLILLITLSFNNLHAQQLAHAQGELIVQLNEQVDGETWVKDISRKYSSTVRIKKRISPILDLYVVEFDFTAINEEQLLLDILRHKQVYLAQYNHFVELRSTIPNDAQFDDQWQYINTGQDGGTIGADIDMELAWDYTTGGVTANGDTIVACVIDDGIDDDHEDIMPNLFINYAEIPDNDIDDDNNGFVDDYRGWYTAAQTDNVYSGGGHGTPVAGIVGAKGNNEVGVSGVSWNVKLMIVRGGSGLESEVLESYSYPLIFRKKYNESNGAEGAFVVTTNASWGIDQGQPDDAPLWCAFYDTLGAYGILNCGATANAEFNIDEVGDLPTACSSDYLISVTNMDRTDTKVNGAGYGLETIDLGAFGAQTWTTSSGGGYGSFGGTSGATPHVTGTIALLYSAECTNIADLALSAPAETALLMRQIILEGTDPNESLQGITVTGGRLNVHNSMKLLTSQHCGDCPPALTSESLSIDENTVQLNWSINDSTNFVNLRYMAVDGADWIQVENAVSPLVLNNLEPCTEYVYQLQSFCNLDTTAYGISSAFMSTGCCENPELVEIINVESTVAEIACSLAESAISYNIRYRELGTTDWSMINISSITFSIDGLSTCTSYELQVQSVCNLMSPEYTSSVFFFTQGCADACSQISYCEVTGYDPSEEWIAGVELGSLTNISEADNGYGAYLDAESKPFIRGGTYELSLTPGYGGQAYTEYFIAWLDDNQDGTFADSEIIFTTVQGVNETVTADITIPLDIYEGRSRLRIGMEYDKLPIACTPEDFDEFGEIEDYCISIGCPTIDSIEVNSVEESNVSFILTGDANASDFEYRYRKISAMDWIDIQNSEMELTLSDLDMCTEYELQARTICSDLQSDFSESFIFKTLCESSTKEAGQAQIMEVHPNPFTSVCTMVLNSTTSLQNCQLIVHNHLGQVVYRQDDLIFVAGENSISLQTETYTSGMYIVQIKNDAFSISRKIVKIK